MTNTTSIKNTIWANSIVALMFTFIGQLSFAAQLPADYKHVKRYSPSGQLLGEISADADSDNQNFIAARYIYSTSRPGLLVRIEYGVLSVWQNETVLPGNWSGFSIKKKESFTYDEYGRKKTVGLTTSGNSYKNLKQYQYDDKGRVKCERVYMDENNLNPVNITTTACATSVTATGSYGPDRITEYEYDDDGDNLDLVTKIRKAVGTTYEQDYATYTYDGYQKLSATDANGNKTEFEYDKFGRLSHWYFPSKTNIGSSTKNHTDPDAEWYVYDDNNNRTEVHKRDDTNVIYYQYDNLNRVTRKLYSNSSYAPVYYDYELQGLEKHARFNSDSGTGVYRNFSGFGELQQESNYLGSKWFHTEHQYDENGNRFEIEHDDNQTFTYLYDGLDRNEYIQENGSTTIITKTYDPNNGSLDLITTSGGVSKNINYEAVQRVSQIVYDFSGTSQDITQGFGYTPAGQLSTFNVDKRIFHYEGTGGRTGEYEVNGLNQYSRVSGVDYYHDDNGNLLYDGGIPYSYDAENRLTAAGSASLTYDPVGRLVKYTIGPNVTYFLWDGDVLIAEVNSSGTVLKRYVHGNALGIPLVGYEGSTVSSTARRFFHTNHQGSVIAYTNNSGSMAASIQKYDAYGVPHGQNTLRFGYTGQLYLREIGMYHYRARIYHPRLGRFLQTDPVGYEDQMNIYAYVGNDPMNMIDPTGMAKCGDLKGEACEDALDDADAAKAEVDAVASQLGGIAKKMQNGDELSPEEQAAVDTVSQMFGSEFASAEGLSKFAGNLNKISDSIGNRGEGMVLNLNTDKTLDKNWAYTKGGETYLTTKYVMGNDAERQVTIIHEGGHYSGLDGYDPVGLSGIETLRRLDSWFIFNSPEAHACLVIPKGCTR